MKKTALITGVCGLIGSEMAREFLDKGYEVIGLDLKKKAPFSHPDFKFFQCDIGDEERVKEVFSGLKSLSVLINNGARANPYNTPLEKMKLKEWNEVLATNLTSVFLLSKYAIPLLKKSRGAIINISSTRHLMAEPHTEIYCTSKGGMNSFTRALAISLGPEVRVNSISPGWIDDPEDKLNEKAHAQHPVGRVGKPSDVTKAALYLSSEDAGFITGQDFVIDGGMVVKMIYVD